MQLDVVDHAPVDLQCCFSLPHQCPLRIDLLARDLFLSVECLIACQVEAGGLERRLIAGQLPLGLRQLHFVGPGVDFGEQVSLVDDLPLGERHAHQFSLHPATDRDGVERHDRTEAVEKQLHLLLPYSLSRHRHDAGRRRLDDRRRGEQSRGQLRKHLGVVEVEAAESARHGDQDERWPPRSPPTGCWGRRAGGRWCLRLVCHVEVLLGGRFSRPISNCWQAAAQEVPETRPEPDRPWQRHRADLRVPLRPSSLHSARRSKPTP